MAPTLPVLPATAHEVTRLLALPADYRVTWVDCGGVPFFTSPEASAGPACSMDAAAIHRDNVAEAFRWGEVYFRWVDSERMSLTAALCVNQRLTGGVVVEIPVDEDTPAQPAALARAIQDTLEAANLCNAALMREKSAAARRERLRAEAIHTLKGESLRALHSIYWNLEPELFMAMRRGDKAEARRLLNHVLLAVYSVASGDLRQTKGIILDLMTMMTRTLVDCGAETMIALGDSYSLLSAMGEIDDEEQLSAWVCSTFEQLIDSPEVKSPDPGTMRGQLILNYVREHCGEALSRDAVAARFGLSRAHFSRALKAGTGQSFSAYLRQVRVGKAVRLLRHTNATVLEVALECGFQDASYFSKVFRQVVGHPPAAYRHNAQDYQRSQPKYKDAAPSFR